MVQISRLVKCAAFGGLLAILAPLAAPGSARAHVIDVFDLTGAFDNGSALSGTVTIDITTGQATAIDAVADGFGINEIDTQFPESFGYVVGTSPSSNNSAHFFLTFADVDLTGYSGGALSTETRVDDFITDPTTSTFLTSGSATLASTSVPEPSTWALMIVGFAGVGFFAVRRAGKAAAATTA
jgi:hypothetical protein